MQEKLAIIDSKHVGKQNTLPAKNAVNDLIYTILDFDRSVSLDIWRIERYVCFWPLWFSKRTILSTVIMFSPLRVTMLQSAGFMPLVGAARFPNLC